MQVTKTYTGTVSLEESTEKREVSYGAATTAAVYPSKVDLINSTIAYFLRRECGVDAWYEARGDSKEHGRTSYENCQKLVRLEKALKYLCGEEYGLHSTYTDVREADSEPSHPLTWQEAEMWVSHMENTNGSHGPHWNMEQVRQVMEQRNITCDTVAFYAVLNAVYSDYCAVAKKYGVNKMDFYADLAKAWIDDEDAVKDKAGRYFEYTVKH